MKMTGAVVGRACKRLAHVCVMFVILVVLCSGCRHYETPLEKVSDSLHGGMTETNVDGLFKGFEIKEPQVFSGQLTGRRLTLFQTNVTYGKMVHYEPKMTGSLFEPVETCIVYFDTNGVIVGYEYLRD